MPETPETHKEIVEIKREVRDVKQTQDAQIFLERMKWEDLLEKALDDDTELMRVLLAIDGMKNAKEIEKELSIYQVKCWRLLNKLEREGIVQKAEETKKGSPVFVKRRWYRILRLDEKVQKKYSSLATSTAPQAPTLGQEDLNASESPSC
jgi:predicted transcriptional regulator